MHVKIFGFLAVIGLALSPALAMAEDEAEIIEYEEEIEAEPETESEDVEEIPIEETRTVSARLSCAEINERVAELREDVKKYPEQAEELETMLARQRSQCAPRANRRPVRDYFNVNPVTVIDSGIVVEETPEPVEEPVVVVEKTPEEIAEAAQKEKDNLANGLCADGSKPNRYGCCAGEKFKEVAQMKFACCVGDSDTDCYEPIKKANK